MGERISQLFKLLPVLPEDISSVPTPTYNDSQPPVTAAL